MNEDIQVYQLLVGLLLTVWYAFCWSRGGRSKKYWGMSPRVWRRLIGPISYTILVLLYSIWTSTFVWLYVAAVPLEKGLSHLGYGGTDILWQKIVRRLVWALRLSLTPLYLVFISGNWLIYAVQLAVSVLTAIAFGVWNPFKKAPVEEGLVLFSSRIFTPFIV